MVDWRSELKRVSKDMLGQAAELQICDNPMHGDYYTNIALKCAGSKAYQVALALKRALKPLEEQIRIQVTKQGFLNFFLSPQVQIQLLSAWCAPSKPSLASADDSLVTSWTSWRKQRVENCMQNFGLSKEDISVGTLCVKGKAQDGFLPFANANLDALWLAVLEHKISTPLELKWVDESVVLSLTRRLHVLFEQWDWQPQNLELFPGISCPQERKLLCFIGQFDEMVEVTAQKLQLNIFNNYLKHIASAMQSYYNVVILQDENLIIRSTRYLLFAAIQNVLKYGLAYLGIENPERIKCQDNNM